MNLALQAESVGLPSCMIIPIKSLTIPIATPTRKAGDDALMVTSSRLNQIIELAITATNIVNILKNTKTAPSGDE